MKLLLADEGDLHPSNKDTTFSFTLDFLSRLLKISDEDGEVHHAEPDSIMLDRVLTSFASVNWEAASAEDDDQIWPQSHCQCEKP